METKQDDTEVLETTVEVVDETTNETQQEETQESKGQTSELEEKIATLEREKQDLEKKNRQLFERTKKVPSQNDLSTKDVLYLAKADIHEEDMEDVTEYAKLKKITVSEAHKFMKPILDVRSEERRTAAATHTKGGARGTTKVSGEDLLRQAEETGEVPDTDEGLNELFRARLARKTSKMHRGK